MDRKLLAILLLGVALRLLFFGHTADDAYITFRYARNLVDGKGFVYNPGERVLGITNPLYGLMIAAGMLFGIDPVIFSKVVGLAGFLVIGLAGWKFLKKTYGDLAAYAFVLMLSVDHYTARWFMSGMETAVFSSLVFVSCTLFLEGKELPAGILAGLSIFVRPEGGFFLPVMFLLSKEKKRIMPGVLIAGLLFVFSQAFYGFPIPYSIYAKSVLNEGGPGNIVESGYHLLNFILKEPFPAFFLMFMSRELLVFVASPLLVFLSYFAMRAPVFFWYYAPYYPLFFLGASVGLLRVAKGIKGSSKYFVAAVLLFISVHQIGFAARELYLQRDALADANVYKEFAVNASGKIAAGDIGIIGYYSGQYVFDLAGLVSPRALECRVDGMMEGCIIELDPDYFVVRKGSFQEELANTAGCNNEIGETDLHYFYEC